MSNILFVCNQGKYRSPTAANFYKKLYPEDNVKYVGVFANQSIKKLLSWSDKIYVMETIQYDEIIKINNTLKTMQKITILNIEDIYKYEDIRLIKILEVKFK